MIRKRRIQNNYIPVFLPILVIVSVLCLGIGFSAFQESMLVTDTVADIRIKKDIRVTNVSQSSATSDAYTNSLDYNNTNVSGIAGLPNSNSSLTYQVEITNIENAEMGIYDLTIDNPNLDYRIEPGYTKGDKLCDNTTPSKCNLGSVSTIYITVSYKENAYDSEHIEQNFIIDFDFRGFHNITYNKITGTYQNEIMSGKTLNVDFGVNALSDVKVTMGATKLSTSDYTYTNGVINIPNVSDDVVIGPKETDESCFVSTEKAVINDYICEDTDVIIPEGLALKVNDEGDSITITKIGDNAFKNKGLTSVVIPEGIITIGSASFKDNNLISISLPDGLKNIYTDAFQNNYITSVIIPNSVTSLQTTVFKNNLISTADLPDNLTSIPNGLFLNNKLETIDIPNSVKSIGGSSFSENLISSITIPEGVTSIGSHAFSYNKLTSISIPDSITSIAMFAFYANELTQIRIGSGLLKINNPNVFNSGTSTKTKMDGTSITYGTNSLTHVVIDNSLEYVTVGSGVFGWASGYSNSNICWLGDDPTCGD